MNIQNKYLAIILTAFIILFPYTITNEEKAAPLFLIVGIICILILDRRQSILKNNNLDKVYLIYLLFLIIFAITSIFQTNNVTKTLNGLCIYLCAFVYYILFSVLISGDKNKSYDVKIRKNISKGSITKEINLKEIILKTLLYCSAVSSLIFVIYQGGVLKLRIYGNLGYANSYALIILIMLILNELFKLHKTYVFFQITFILTLILTGSRNTLFYFGIFIIIKFILYLKNKDENFYVLVFDTGVATFIYILISLKYYPLLVLVPIVVYLTYELTNKLSDKVKIVAAVFIIGVTFLVATYTNLNTISRLKNFSLNSSVLQERLIYYQDGIRHIVNNPIGSGINSFEYRQFYEQSAFYDVKYIHNSFLQVGYDTGILGMISFIGLFIYGFIKIIKERSDDNVWLAFAYLITFLHSLLDFDFSFVSIFIIFILIFIMGRKDRDFLKLLKKENKEKYFKKIGYTFYSVSLMLCTYLIIVNSVYSMGDNLVLRGQYEKAIKIYDINKEITLRDPDVYSKEAEVYKRKGGNDEKSLSQCIDLLSVAEKINPYDPRTTANMGIIYEILNKSNDADYCYNYVVDHAKFNKELYLIYEKFLNKQYKITKSESYIVKIDKLKNKFHNNKVIINPRYIYLNDQMGEFNN